MRKLDKTLGFIWLLLSPIAISIFTIFTAIYLFIVYDDEYGAMLLNIACLFSVLWLGGFIINLILSWIILIKDKILSHYLDKHPEKCVSTEQLAQDFEKLAQALRENDKEKENKE